MPLSTLGKLQRFHLDNTVKFWCISYVDALVYG
jgi:hypothetical protein